MPKIVIKEYDKTDAGYVAGNNFSVVVPGFVKSGVRITADKSATGKDIYYGFDDLGEPVFDENGVYVCNSKADFEKYIGKVAAAGDTIEATAPTVSIQEHTLTAQEFFETYKNQVYTRAEITEKARKTIGRLREQSGDKFYEYIPVASDAWNDSALFSVILTGNEGWDATEANYQYGNQIADILLSVGYTVVYLKLNQLSDIKNPAIWEPLRDRSLYDFRYIISGMLSDCGATNVSDINTIISDLANNVVNSDSELANGRGDCVALLDVAKAVYAGKTTAEAISRIKENIGIQNAYSAYFAPTVFYGGMSDADYNSNNEFPGSVHYLMCAANSTARYPEWYAVSGYTRGVSTYNVVGTSLKLGDAAVNALQPRTNKTGTSAGINLIINLNNAYYLWGNRTSCALDNKGLVASHFLNIRQLCCTLKKTIYNTCRQLMFDPNSDILWLNFCNAIRPVLERMKANQGIADYRFEKKDTPLKAKLFAAIRIVPIEAVEDFEIGITLEDSLDDTIISIEEHLVD